MKWLHEVLNFTFLTLRKNTLRECRKLWKGKKLFKLIKVKTFNTINRAVYINRSQLAMLRQNLLNTNFRGALLSSEEHTAYLNAQVFPHHHYHYASEIVFVFNLCIYLHRQSCLTQEINVNILNFQSNGLLQSWSKEFVDMSYLKERISAVPKVLTNEQLFGSYELLASGLIISIIVFIIELLSVKVPRMKKFMRNL